MDAPELPEVETTDKTFARRAALTTAIYAVILAIASLGGDNATKEMLLAQQQASDQWAFYQAKVIREHQYRLQKLHLEVEIAERGPTMDAAARQRYQEGLRQVAQEEERYGAEKKDIELAARKLEQERDINRQRDPNFDYAQVLLQIAIVTASVSILASSWLLYVFSLLFASLGTLLMLNGYLLLVSFLS
jgi:Domain of unknown function (DUF4337)